MSAISVIIYAPNMKKILIVDDEEISLCMTDHILSEFYETVCASSGQEALDLYAEEKPDLVLTDLYMPKMTGYELKEKIQAMSSEIVPVMFMTAETSIEEESKGFESGAMDFIRKPFRADVLLKRIGNIIQTQEKIRGLQTAAFTDPMTGCLNKSASQERIADICHKIPGALMIIDLDSFKLVNDIYGHAMGDKVLIRFAEILRSVMRTDDIVGRLGGDEFIAFCQNVNDFEVIKKKTEYMNKHILESAIDFMGEQMNIPLGVSVGCVFSPDEGIDFTDLYKKADKALYSVKQNGKHGADIFKSEEGESPKEKNLSEGLGQITQILSERNQGKGAYELGFDQFRTVYRFTSRIITNYKHKASLILFTIESAEKSVLPVLDVTEYFFQILKETLRQSDVISLNGNNSCLALILKANSHEIKIVIDRIMKNWNEKSPDSTYKIKYEINKVGE